MNRFAHENIDPTITHQQRLLVMTKVIGPHKVKRGYANGVDEYALKRLQRRARAFNSMTTLAAIGYTFPGSMNRSSSK